MARKTASHQLGIAWGPGIETDDGDWEVDETHLHGTILDSGAITFRASGRSEPPIAWEEDGDIEVLLDDRLAAYVVHSYLLVHGAPTPEDFK